MNKNMYNISHLLNTVIDEFPDNVAIIDDEGSIRFIEMWDIIEKLSKAFVYIDLQEDDKVVVLLPNSKEFVSTFFALLNVGSIAVPVQPIFTNREYKQIFEEIEPACIVTTSYALSKLLSSNDSNLHGYKFILTDADNPIETTGNEILYLKDLIIKSIDTNFRAYAACENKIASINYTYRGYGYPLGAMLTHKNYIDSVEMIAALNYPRSEKYLSVLPMAHIFSLISYVLMPLLKGLSVVISKSHSSADFFRMIETNKVDVIYGVPTFFTYLLKSFEKTKFDMTSIKYAVSGGSFLSQDIHRELESGLGIRIYQGYGLTEGLIATANVDLKNRIGSLGLPLEGVEVKIVDENGNENERGIKGEIALKSRSVMQGYYKREKETSAVLKDGWLYTGDYGVLDDDGYVYFEGLKKNIAKVGGHVVDLKEVEDVLSSCHCVLHSKVYSADDPFWGQAVVAEVIVNKEVTEEDLLSFCSRRLAVFKIPKNFYITKKDNENN